MPGVPVTVPSVGESITEGTLSRWLKTDGANVQAGEPLFELETDKVTSDVPAERSGVLKISVAEGETVAIGATIGTIEPAGPATARGDVSSAGSTKDRATPSKSDAPKPPVKPATDAVPATAESSSRPPPSPAVRRLAAERDVDLGDVTATGPGGRVTKGDVLAFLDSAGSQAAAPPVDSKPEPEKESPTRATPRDTEPSPAVAAPGAAATSVPAAPPPAGPRETRQKMSRLRARIAQRLVEVQQTTAILTTFNEADMSRVIDLRTLYKEPFQKKHGISLGFSSFFVKAAIEGLKAFPVVNARIDGDEIVFQNFHDIGIAVSTEKGLMVPVLRDADRLSLAAIEQAVADVAARARKGTITLDDLQGGTFTITNGGVFGSLMSTPILNPPQSAILGMHAIKKRPVVVDDQVVVRPMMYLALSYDHRLIDGREAVSFLVRVKDCIESPERMLLEI
jgi:2-oxoglutarate dehydrogenase E2 component (dihydrolipoamide succinyltransferase)